VHGNYTGKVFEFETESKLKCPECSGVRISFAKSPILQLFLPPLPPDVDENTQIKIFDCLNKFTANEIVEFNCPNCKKAQLFTK
jgi:ubiquitin carboxyl-terminal hydrolase 5/13